jgi:26S proteasome regulatory subunit N3
MVELNDIEMKEVDPSNGSNPTNTTTISKDDKKDANTLTLDDIKEQVRTIEKAVSSKEPRYILRVLRGLASTRKRLNEDVIRRLILFYYGSNSSEREILLGFAQSISQPIDVDMEKASHSPAPSTSEKQSVSRPQTSRARAASLPEVDLYIHLIVLLYLIDRNSLKSALDCAKRLVDKTSVLNRRTLDLLSAKCYFYYARIFELNNMLDTIRPFLHSRLRTATLRNDFEGTAVLINLLLRNYLHYNLYSQAQKLVLKSVFPDHASNNEWARYHYYLG